MGFKFTIYNNLFTPCQRAVDLLEVAGVGDGAQRHGRGGMAVCLAPPRPPSLHKRCKKARRPRTALRRSAACFAQTEDVSLNRLKGECEEEPPPPVFSSNAFLAAERRWPRRRRKGTAAGGGSERPKGRNAALPLKPPETKDCSFPIVFQFPASATC